MTVATIRRAGPGGLAETTPRTRLSSIDLLRGLVMIVMVLDHTRDYVHVGGLAEDATNLATTTPILFLTRWVTHFCAPIFVFLAGVGAYLQQSRGMSTRDLSRFLVTRGLWLLVLEATVIRTSTWFNLDYSFFSNLQVIWALGVSMILLAALIHLPLGAIATFGGVVVLAHNAFDGIHVVSWQGPGTPAADVWGKLWILLHQAGEFVPIVGNSGPIVFALYPLVPWIGVIALGYVTGALYELDPERRKMWLRRIGLALIGGFIVLRATNLYGDPSPWSPQRTLWLSAFSFVRATKYPVSLIYLLMTIGPALLALAWFESRQPTRVEQTITRIGRVPLFFYLLQWPLTHTIAILASLAAGKSVSHYFMNPPAVFGAVPANAGFDLPIVYLCWLIALLILCPLSLWFAGVKTRHPWWWLRYL